MIFAATLEACHLTDVETQKKALSLRILKYGENKAFFDQILSRKNAVARQNSILAYSLLDELLSRHTELDMAVLYRDSLGKPHIRDEKISFSISHTDTAVACAVDTEGSPVGIDIEKPERDGANIINRFFDLAAKSRYAESQNKLLTFAEIWTEKEAYSKFLGTGITDYKTDYPVPHSFTHFPLGELFVTVCGGENKAVRFSFDGQ